MVWRSIYEGLTRAYFFDVMTAYSDVERVLPDVMGKKGDVMAV